MANGTDFKQLLDEALDENESLRRALIAVLLSVGGSAEIGDSVVTSISSKDRIVSESDPVNNSHHVWVVRADKVQH